jgi:hypothetical protein
MDRLGFFVNGKIFSGLKNVWWSFVSRAAAH